MGNVGIKGVTDAAGTTDTEGWEVVGHEREERDGNSTTTQVEIDDCTDHAERRCPSMFDGRACIIM